MLVVQRAVSRSLVLCMVRTTAATIWGDCIRARRDASFLESWLTIMAALLTTTWGGERSRQVGRGHTAAHHRRDPSLPGESRPRAATHRAAQGGSGAAELAQQRRQGLLFLTIIIHDAPGATLQFAAAGSTQSGPQSTSVLQGRAGGGQGGLEHREPARSTQHLCKARAGEAACLSSEDRL